MRVPFEQWAHHARHWPWMPWCAGVGASVVWSVVQPGATPEWCNALVHALVVVGALQMHAREQQGAQRQVEQKSKPEAADQAQLAPALQILQRQVHTGIVNSEAAVMQAVSKLSEVQRISAALHSEASSAIEHSNHISSELQKLSGESELALRDLEQQQTALAKYQSSKDAQVALAMQDVAALTPLVEMIGTIAKQTHLLSFNAAIEAARAGNTGSGFKIVATEVRALAQQTTDAAKQIAVGIEKVQKAVHSNNVLQATELQDMLQSVNAIRALLARNMEHTSALGPFLHQLSHGMDQGTATIRSEVVEALGQMQFQDVLRQLLEQVERGLQALAEFNQMVTQGMSPDVTLQDLMLQWQDSYVMFEQRAAHDSAPGTAQTDTVKVDDGPKIELF